MAALSTSGSISFQQIQDVHGGSHPISISEYYGKYKQNNTRIATSGTLGMSDLRGTGTAINQSWGGWSGWGSCSASCGGGTQTRSRSCNGTAEYGGSACSGSSSDSQSCNTQSCGPSGTYTFDVGGSYTWTANNTGTISVYSEGPGNWRLGSTGTYFTGCSSCGSGHWDRRGVTTSAFGTTRAGQYIQHHGGQTATIHVSAQYGSYSVNVTAGTTYTIEIGIASLMRSNWMYTGRVEITDNT